jgi:hypothetical protein
MLDWSVYNNPVLSDGKVYLPSLHARGAVTEANFSTLALGGFGDGALTLQNVPDALIFDAVGIGGAGSWLMKEIRVHDGQGARAYEGIIAEIHAKRGKHRYNRMLTPMFNRIRCEYWQPDPLHPGQRRQGILQRNDTASQALYGIKEYRLDLTNDGTMKQAQAQNRADDFLQMSRLPHEFDFEIGDKRDDVMESAEEGNELQLKLWGYWSTLKWRYTNFRVRTPTDLQTIFYKSGNNLSLYTLYLNGYYLQFVDVTNTANLKNTGISLVYNSAGSLMTVQDFVNAILGYGDANLRRAYFQIWENRTGYLAVRSTAPTLYTRSRDGRAWSVNRTPLPAYMVRAGGYLVPEDFPSSLDDYSGDIANDPRASFVDATNYDDMTGLVRTQEPQADNAALLLGRVVGKRRIVHG